ncbi:MAG: transcriptional repressor LexA [Parasporobacterium sp.]|nr:transcriptional repressor LexA [Parasporobacterium sp.]
MTDKSAAEKSSLSEKQTAILEFIKKETLSRGYPPAVREICTAVGLNSPASVHSHLNALEAKGYIRRDPSKPRAIEIIDEDFALTRREYAQIPMVGYVAAGEPLLAEEHIRDYFPIPADMLPNSQVFMLKVRGDSMTGAGILDGDQVIVRQTSTASNGDMVVALIEDGATVKTFYKEKDHIRLQPENPDYDPIILSDVTILGEVIGVFRLF